jgi:acyl-CoA thioesterase FadM
MEFACISLKNGQPTKMPEPFVDALEKGLQQSQVMI